MALRIFTCPKCGAEYKQSSQVAPICNNNHISEQTKGTVVKESAPQEPAPQTADETTTAEPVPCANCGKNHKTGSAAEAKCLQELKEKGVS
jgi:DNA-directed RNA polymerase subunit M/transcription elongation factor TFIIS